jgi:dienelactone hydrolase
MRSSAPTTWLGAALLLAACGGADAPTDESPAEGQASFCESSTQWLYEPLGEGGVAAFPDDVHTVADPASATGRRVAFDPVHDAWLASLEPAVTAVYETLEGLDGWGVTAPIVLQFSAPLGDVPAWQVSQETDVIWLVRLSGDGVERHPYEVHLMEEGATTVIWPMGPLEPATEYALLVTSALLDADGGCVAPSPTARAMLEGAHDDARLDHASERLSTFIEAAGLVPEQVSAGVTFTTQPTTDLSEAVAARISTESFAWSDEAVCEVDDGLRACERHFTSWDYRADGVMGATPVSAWEIVTSVWMPTEGEGPWPTLVMGHGINSSRGMGHGIARSVADLGIVVVAIDAVGHGDHPSNEGNQGYSGMMSFLGIDAVNLRIDGTALRDNLRQSTADRLQLIELLVQDGDLDGDGGLDVDVDRMGYVGISLGGIMGSEILALSERLDVGVLITAAARMTSIFTYASNMAIMMDVMLELTGSESATWQAIAAIQGAIDPGDPLAYARHVITDRLNDAPAPHVLVTMAVGDPIVPNEGTRALAQGLGVDIMHPVVEDMGLTRLASGSPVGGNLTLDSGVSTGALFQFDRVTDGDGVVAADHDNLPYSDESIHQLRHFLATWLGPGAVPEIVDPYPILGTPELGQ